MIYLVKIPWDSLRAKFPKQSGITSDVFIIRFLESLGIDLKERYHGPDGFLCWDLEAKSLSEARELADKINNALPEADAGTQEAVGTNWAVSVHEIDNVESYDVLNNNADGSLYTYNFKRKNIPRVMDESVENVSLKVGDVLKCVQTASKFDNISVGHNYEIDGVDQFTPSIAAFRFKGQLSWFNTYDHGKFFSLEVRRSDNKRVQDESVLGELRNFLQENDEVLVVLNPQFEVPASSITLKVVTVKSTGQLEGISIDSKDMFNDLLVSPIYSTDEEVWKRTKKEISDRLLKILKTDHMPSFDKGIADLADRIYKWVERQFIVAAVSEGKYGLFLRHARPSINRVMDEGIFNDDVGSIKTMPVPTSPMTFIVSASKNGVIANVRLENGTWVWGLNWIFANSSTECIDSLVSDLDRKMVDLKDEFRCFKLDITGIKEQILDWLRKKCTLEHIRQDDKNIYYFVVKKQRTDVMQVQDESEEFDKEDQQLIQEAKAKGERLFRASAPVSQTSSRALDAAEGEGSPLRGDGASALLRLGRKIANRKFVSRELAEKIFLHLNRFKNQHSEYAKCGFKLLGGAAMISELKRFFNEEDRRSKREEEDARESK